MTFFPFLIFKGGVYTWVYTFLIYTLLHYFFKHYFFKLFKHTLIYTFYYTFLHFTTLLFPPFKLFSKIFQKNTPYFLDIHLTFSIYIFQKSSSKHSIYQNIPFSNTNFIKHPFHITYVEKNRF